MFVNWQEILSLLVVAITGTLFVIKYIRNQRNHKIDCENGCGCSVSKPNVLELKNQVSEL